MGAWLCGSAVACVEGKTELQPRDSDVMVPPDQWQSACRLIRAAGYEVQLNRLGGLKIKLESWELDLWPGTIESLLSEATVRLQNVKLVRYRPYAMVEIST